MSLHVASSETALTQQTLGHRVHRDHLYIMSIWISHLMEYLSYRVELFALLVNILLVNLVSHDQD